jgi:transcriptional regulator with AAA-type ATPase domain
MSVRLRESDRALFTLVSQAAFENPFSDKRSLLDAAIADSPGDDPSWVRRMLHKLGSRLSALEHGGRLTLAAYPQPDRELIEHSVLFEIFHRYLEALDALIAAQDEAGDTPQRVTFADDFCAQLQERGFALDYAQRMLELFYQMRRAHHFIAKRLTGGAPCMKLLRQSLWQAVFTRNIRSYERHLWNRMEDFSTLLLGETGTGKGACAAALGLSGFIPFDAKKRSFAHGFHRNYVPINLNEFPESLFESEIFGHRKGSFTGAVDNHDGALARCGEHGTVFFDEIGEATLPVQVKLLRVLQERVFSAVGSRESQRFRGRIVAATHRSLSELRAQGTMRDDFYYRLCSNVIEVPPLRQRIAEDANACRDLVGQLCERIIGHSAPELVAETLRSVERDLGKRYAFPGNVRELEQCVRRVLVTGSCKPDTKAQPRSQDHLQAALGHAELSAGALIQLYCKQLYARTGSYVEVARRTQLDRRTVKKYVETAGA